VESTTKHDKSDGKLAVATVIGALVTAGGAYLANRSALVPPSDKQVELSQLYVEMRRDYQAEVNALKAQVEDWRKKSADFENQLRIKETQPKPVCPAIPECPSPTSVASDSAPASPGVEDPTANNLTQVLLGEWRGISDKNGKAGLTLIFKKDGNDGLVADALFYPIPENLTVEEKKYRVAVSINNTTGIVTLEQRSLVRPNDTFTTRVGTISEDGQVLEGIAGGQNHWTFSVRKQR
jgi:hypothetical protein